MKNIDETELFGKDYLNSILNNAFNKRGFSIGDAVHVITTNTNGRIIDGGNTEEWGDQCRTDIDGMRSFSDLKHYDAKKHWEAHSAMGFMGGVKNYRLSLLKNNACGDIGGKEVAEKGSNYYLIRIAELSDYKAYLHYTNRPKALQDIVTETINLLKEWAIS